ncbi:MAG: flagellar assembly protein FlaJ, partial [Nitrosotalea sp.]
MMEKLAIKEKLASMRKSDEDLLYFVAFLYALATGEVGSVDLIKSGVTSGYGRYSDSFREVYRLGVGWGYGLARSCEMIASKMKDNSDPLKQLLVKLSQVIRLGDELRVFFTDEMASAIHVYSIRYERSLETQKLFLEMFYTISSTASFMIASNSIMAMLMGSSNSESVFTMSFVGVIVSMGAFIVIMYVLFPKDKLSTGKYTGSQKFKMTFFVTLGAGIAIGIALT